MFSSWYCIPCLQRIRHTRIPFCPTENVRQTPPDNAIYWNLHVDCVDSQLTSIHPFLVFSSVLDSSGEDARVNSAYSTWYYHRKNCNDVWLSEIVFFASQKCWCRGRYNIIIVASRFNVNLLLNNSLWSTDNKDCTLNFTHCALHVTHCNTTINNGQQR